MAKTASTTKQSDILSRVTELGQEALNRLADVPGGSRLVDMMNESKTRMDEMQKKLRGFDALERRVSALEQRLASLDKQPKPAAKKPVSKKPVARKPKPAAPKAPPV